MFVAIIPGANLPGVLGGMVVQKIFFTVAGAFVYVYLFLSVPGSFDLQLPTLSDHPVLSLGLVAGAGMLLVILGRIFWRKLQGLWAKAVQGGAILARRRDYALLVVLPSFGAWLAKLGVIAVFLAGYGITVTFHTVMSVMGGNSIANTVSVTPGGVGVNQATNVAALNDVTDAATATAYSLGQQLAITAWNIVFAIVLVVWAFGWTGGKLLVEQSYTDAKVKVGRAEGPARSHQSDETRRTGSAAAQTRRRKETMSNLLAIAYPDAETAEKVRAELMQATKEHLIELDDAVVIEHRLDGKIKLHQGMSGTGAGAAAGAMGGTLIGLVFLAPLLGLAIGAATGAVAGRMSDAGVDDAFLKTLGDSVPAGAAALMVLGRSSAPERVLERVRPYGGEVIQTSLDSEQEAHLRAALGETAPVAP